MRLPRTGLPRTRLPRTKLCRVLGTLGVASALAVAAGSGALAHDPGQTRQGGAPITGYPHAGMMHHGMGAYGMTNQGQVDRGMVGRAYGPGPMGPGYGYGPMGPGMGYGMGPNTVPGGPAYGPGPMRPGYGHGYGYAPGPMPGGGMGPGLGHDRLLSLPEDLTREQVRHMFEHRLEWEGNPNIKVGEVAEADEDTITVEIVTRDGSLVQRFAVDPHTGLFRPAEQQAE